MAKGRGRGWWGDRAGHSAAKKKGGKRGRKKRKFSLARESAASKKARSLQL